MVHSYAEFNNQIMKTSLIFLLGLGMGCVLGLLVAPEAGRITRRKIRDEADKIIDKALAKKQLTQLENELPDEVIVVEEKYTV